MEEKPYLEVHRRDVVHELQSIGVRQLMAGLHLHDYTALHEQIDAVETDRLTAEEDLDREFALHQESAPPEGDFERSLVNALEEAKAERVVDLEKCADDLPRQLLLHQRPAPGALARVRPIRVHPSNPTDPSDLAGTIFLRDVSFHFLYHHRVPIANPVWRCRSRREQLLRSALDYSITTAERRRSRYSRTPRSGASPSWPA